MLSNYGGNIAVEDEEKPTFSDIDDEDYDEEDDVEDWDNWTEVMEEPMQRNLPYLRQDPSYRY